MRRMCFVLPFAVACGRIGFGVPDADRGAGPDANVDPDSGIAGRCSAFGPWSAPVNLRTVNSSSQDWAPWISSDGLELVFSSYRTGPPRLYRTIRPDRASPFALPQAVPLDRNASEATLSADRLTVWFSNTPNGYSQTDIWVATRADANAAFGPSSVVAVLNGATYADLDPSVSDDELTIAFHSTRSGTEDIFVSTRATRTAPWGAPMPQPALSTSAVDWEPALTDDAAELYFSSDRIGSTERIYRATRLNGAYVAPVAMTETLVGGGAETSPAISGDQRTMVFTSSSNAGEGAEDIWEIQRDCL